VFLIIQHLFHGVTVDDCFVVLFCCFRKLYFSDNSQNKIVVCELNGTSQKTLIEEGLSYPRAVALHPLKGFVFINRACNILELWLYIHLKGLYIFRWTVLNIPYLYDTIVSIFAV